MWTTDTTRLPEIQNELTTLGDTDGDLAWREEFEKESDILSEALIMASEDLRTRKIQISELELDVQDCRLELEDFEVELEQVY